MLVAWPCGHYLLATPFPCTTQTPFLPPWTWRTIYQCLQMKLTWSNFLSTMFWRSWTTSANCFWMQASGWHLARGGDFGHLSPSGINWSNIVDYTGRASFHAIATRCSAQDGSTVHYVYSMEWVKDVYGVGLSDWCRGGQAVRASMLTELETGKALQEFAKEAKLNSLLRLPGLGCPSRMWMYTTAMHLHHSWVARFASMSAAVGAVTLQSLGMSLPFMMHRRFPTNIYLKWSYSGEFAVPEISQAMKRYNATLGDVARRLLQTKRSSWLQKLGAERLMPAIG